MALNGVSLHKQIGSRAEMGAVSLGGGVRSQYVPAGFDIVSLYK